MVICSLLLQMSAVVGVPHPRLGQAVAAAVVLRGVGGEGKAIGGSGSARGGVGASSPQVCGGDKDNGREHVQLLRGALEGQECGDACGELLRYCRQALSPFKVPPHCPSPPLFCSSSNPAYSYPHPLLAAHSCLPLDHSLPPGSDTRHTHYQQVPRRLRVWPEPALPTNSSGKVAKPIVREFLAAEGPSSFSPSNTHSRL